MNAILEMDKGWAPAQVRKLGDVTDFILSRFEKPTRPRKMGQTGHGGRASAIR